MVLDLSQGLKKNASKAPQSFKWKPARGNSKKKRKKGGNHE